MSLSYYILVFVILTLAVYRLTRLTIEDTITEPLREIIWRRFPPETNKFGYLFTCPWCVSIWWSGLAVALFIFFPIATLIASGILAISTVVGIFYSKLES